MLGVDVVETIQWLFSQCTIAGSGIESRRLLDTLAVRTASPSDSAPRAIPSRLVPSIAVFTASRTREMDTLRP